jgi:spore maturation protein SpmA
LQIERIGEGAGVQWVEALVELSRVVETFAKRLIRNVDPGHRECLVENGMMERITARTLGLILMAASIFHRRE